MYCDNCGFDVKQAWKHCPRCGKNQRPAQPAKEYVTSEEVGLPVPPPDDWDPLFIKASDIENELVNESKLADFSFPSIDSDWDPYWVEKFEADEYRVVFIRKAGGADDDFQTALDLVITGVPAKDLERTTRSELTSPEIRLVDDNWYIEITDVDGDTKAERKIAKDLQDKYGGKIQVTNPLKEE